MKDDMRVISTEEELKVFTDPYRMKIIRTFQQHIEPLTVKGCADIMGEVPAKVHYHVKKLLKVNILELDHIEVINGINAKFYKLPKTSFTISIKDNDGTGEYKQLNQVHILIDQIISSFKDDFMKSSSRAIENKSKKDSEVGMIASNQVYLTEEEFNEISDFLKAFTDKNKYPKDGANVYTFLGGLGRKFED